MKARIFGRLKAAKAENGEKQAVHTALGHIVPRRLAEGLTAREGTLGGVATDQLDQQTMATKSVPGLYFIGGVGDVTGWLGGYNFQ